VVAGNRRHEHEKQRTTRLLMPALTLCAVAIGGLALWNVVRNREGGWAPVRYVRVEGDILNLEPEKFRQALMPAVSRGYFSLDISEIEGVARSFAWIDRVHISRLWPDTVGVSVSEHKPVVRWGAKALLNQRGERFAPAELDAFAALPQLEGPPGTEGAVLSVLDGLNEKLKGDDLRVTWLGLNKRRAWAAKLSNGTEVRFGTQDPVKMLDWFLALVPKLGEDKLARMQRVDLRYRSGFAMVLKPAAGVEGHAVKEKAGTGINATASHLALENQ
jgi:cell division protein FtsQ